LREITIAQIRIGKRFRKDLGNIGELAESIEDVGLLHPVVIDNEANLIAGYRRIMAAKKLGWRKIECKIISLDENRYGEIEENQNRKDFTASEIADIAEWVESHKKPGRPAKWGESPQLPHGRTHEVVAKITGVSDNTVKKIKKIKEAADKQPQKYAHILERLDSKKLSVDTAHRIVTCEERNLPKTPLPEGKFDVIYADPALRFENRSIRGSADNHYDTMALRDICNMKIPAADNAVLFLWMPSSMFFDEIDMAEFGEDSSLSHILWNCGEFQPKTFFVWKKDRIGTGSWHRNQHENLVMAIKGKMPTPAKLFPSIIEAPRTDHSRKPDIVYPMIEQMYPKRNYLELFARKKHSDKWTAWGNQIKEAITA
jgi:N6-adenosine-specific RNA methylase IME4/ParB-like chromosome segregation protein Spo0J